MSTADAIRELLDLTRDPDPKTRAYAVRELCPCQLKRNASAVWDRLLEMVEDPDANVRGHALHVLADGSPRDRAPQIAAAIAKMEQDPDIKLRRRVRKWLAQHRRTGRVNVL